MFGKSKEQRELEKKKKWNDAMVMDEFTSALRKIIKKNGLERYSEISGNELQLSGCLEKMDRYSKIDGKKIGEYKLTIRQIDLSKDYVCVDNEFVVYISPGLYDKIVALVPSQDEVYDLMSKAVCSKQ